MNLGLGGKKIVVSGAANGIGTAICCGLLGEGAYPIGIDIKPLAGSELEQKLRDYKLPKDYDFYQGDASKIIEMRRVLKRFDHLDGLVNNAGLLGDDYAHGGRTIKAWDKMMDAHAKTAYVLTELCYPKMKDGGSIVNIGSIELDMASPDIVLYTASKGALLGITVTYSITLADKNIRVNMVSPGNVNTERNKAQYADNQDVIKGFE